MDRYDPFDSMDRMFDQLRRSMLESTGGHRALPGREEDIVVSDEDFGLDSVGIRLEPTETGYVAMADLPGFEREELTVSFDDGVLTIAAVHEASEDDELTVRKHTRRVRESVRVPGDVAVDEIAGTYRNGVLEVTLPTTEAPDEDAHVIDIE